MNLLKKYSVILGLVIFIAMFFLGCESNFKDVQRSNFIEFVPASDADNVNIKYTDSGLISGILISPKMLDYSNVSFPFTDFPKGIDVTLYDKKRKRTYVVANYAISYKQTSVIDLQGKVKITTDDGQMLETEQLYFDQKNEWFYTERKFKFTDAKGVSYGQGLDFSKDFKMINSQRITGEIETEE
ncbi:LPS export ABC transporter periplasmic protein LptC [Flavobacterium sp. 140616W15]|uniref:LPS export ABC transporter periplasmic protein LptC n=1 Tax=Flavobacterium sp. 140616W15 TaxID=2478552 RepID=UPI000F0BF9BF|nr:LPS export ABC transporter periplasmic protein LptC [Flavobacterium sp. 140616W15]AYN05431.1 LPS export ABC transporter periplasmic protein LptC [Flavobacterium sp. 140616W15]